MDAGIKFTVANSGSNLSGGLGGFQTLYYLQTLLTGDK